MLNDVVKVEEENQLGSNETVMLYLPLKPFNCRNVFDGLNEIGLLILMQQKDSFCLARI